MPEIRNFIEVLDQAVRQVKCAFFKIPVSRGTPISRERVFCYELYHQFRKITEADESEIIVHAEMDKCGHQEIRTKRKPDFIWHVPGTNQNYVVMEVKSAIKLKKVQLKKDIETLNEFVGKWHYEVGVLFIYSIENSEEIKNAVKRKVPWELIGPGVTVYLGFPNGIELLRNQLCN
jgi:hypothetical protein